MDLIEVFTKFGVTGLLLLTVGYLVSVVRYLYLKGEEREKVYVEMVKEMVACLTRLQEHLDEGEK